MNVEIPEKLAAFAAALAINALIITGVEYMFSVPAESHTAGIASSGPRRQCGCTPRGDDYCRCAATSQLSSNGRSQCAMRAATSAVILYWVAVAENVRRSAGAVRRECV